MTSRLRFLLASLLWSSSTFAFTVVHPNEPKFYINPVYVDYSATDCTGLYTTAELAELIGHAIDDYWNSVPYSSLELRLGDDRTNPGHVAGSSATVIRNNRIFVECASSGISGSWGTGVMGEGTISSNGSTTGGWLRINNAADGAIDLPAGQQIRLVAHELGHTIGLGHSNKSEALMYYTLSIALDNGMSDDDAAGVTYLYGKGLSEVFTSCTTVEQATRRNPPGDGKAAIASLGFFTLLGLFWRQLRNHGASIS